MTGKRAIARGAFQPAEGAIYEIEIAEGEIVELAGDNAPLGWQAVVINGIEGIVPLSFLDIIPEDASPDGGEDVTLDDSERNTQDSDDPIDEATDDDANRRMCIFDFNAEPGSMYEVSLTKGEIVELTDQEAPAGWATVKTENDSEGLVPLVVLGAAPRLNPEGPTQEELELRKAKEQKAELEEQLKRANDALKALERKKDEELDEAAEREEELKKKMKEMEERDEERQKAENERIAEREREKQAEAERLKRLEEDEAIWPSKDQVKLKKALKEAEEIRVAAEKNYMEVEERRVEAQKALQEAERRAFDAAKKVRAQEHARDANERALQLLPGVKELFAPTQNELQKAVQTVANAVMKNAEDSAKLLAKLAVKEDPAAELELARERRIEQQALQKGERSLGSGRLHLTDLIVPGDEGSFDAISPRPPTSGQPGWLGRARVGRGPNSLSTTSTPSAHGTISGPPSTASRLTPRDGSSNWQRPNSSLAASRQSMPDKLRTETRTAKEMPVQPHGPPTRLPPQSRGRPRSSRPVSARTHRPPSAKKAPPANRGGADGASAVGSSSAARPPESLDSASEALSSVLPETPRTKAKKEAAYKTIARVAPETKHHASKIEATQRALRRELKAARRAIVESRYGEIDMPDLTPSQRIQNRNVHAAYSFVMRQQQGRNNEMVRSQAFAGSLAR